jgi:hypothetical protein
MAWIEITQPKYDGRGLRFASDSTDSSRLVAGRAETPTVGNIDSQSVKNKPTAMVHEASIADLTL